MNRYSSYESCDGKSEVDALGGIIKVSPQCKITNFAGKVYPCEDMIQFLYTLEWLKDKGVYVPKGAIEGARRELVGESYSVWQLRMIIEILGSQIGCLTAEHDEIFVLPNKGEFEISEEDRYFLEEYLCSPDGDGYMVYL